MLMLAMVVAAAAPQACLRPGWKQLSGMVGDWNVGITHRNAQRQFEEGRARSKVRAGILPCTITDEISGTLSGRRLSFVSLVTISPDGSVERVYADSEHGRLLHYSGRFDGPTLHFSMDYPAPAKFAAAADFDLSERRRPKVTHLLRTQDRGAWEPVLILRYSRKQ